MRVYQCVIFFLVCIVLSSCINTTGVRIAAQFDGQGHRGARGVYPENTLLGFYEAIDHGMRTLELDVAISADSIVFVSHEPWFNPSICDIEAYGYADKASLFRLDYADIAKVDCGSKGNLNFPYQHKVFAVKPTLKEVIIESQKHAVQTAKPLPYFNIEIKTEPGEEGYYTPEIEDFVKLVMDQVIDLDVLDRTTIQSFDQRPLKMLHEQYPDVRLTLLSASPLSYKSELTDLGFMPSVYSPYHLTLRPGTVKALHSEGIHVIPWTVNDVTRMSELIKWGVDGIITDYPDKLESIYPELK